MNIHPTNVDPADLAGVDEAGRGPLAGPVAAAAVILDPDRMPAGLTDSKALTVAERERLFPEILARARVGLAFASAEEIGRLNIRGATLLAMARAIARLSPAPTLALIDGRDVPPTSVPARAIIGGDASEPAIGAASIVAKVARDRLLMRLDTRWPGYGLAGHKGYPTEAHREALARLGPCPEHRRGFAPVEEAYRALES
ncbi:MAG: ribonuclease HII [Pseudomonadota bacterium]